MSPKEALIISTVLVFSVVGVAFLLQGAVDRAGAEEATLNGFLSWVHNMAINSTYTFSAPNSTEAFRISVTERYNITESTLKKPHLSYGLPRGQGKVAIAFIWRAPAGTKADKTVDPLVVSWITSPEKMKESKGTNLRIPEYVVPVLPLLQEGFNPVVSTPEGYVGMVVDAAHLYPDKTPPGDYQLFVWY